MSRRIALIVPVFPVLSETFIIRHWTGLVARGWDAHIVCARFDTDAWQRWSAAFLPATAARLQRRIHVAPSTSSVVSALRHLPARLGSALARPLRTATYWHRSGGAPTARRLKDLYLDGPLIALQPELVHFELGSLAHGRMHLRHRLDTTVVVSFRGFDISFVGLEKPGYYDDVWRHADRLHFLGRDLKRRAEKRGCPVDVPHDLVAPAVDTTRFDPQPRRPAEDDRLRIVSVGRLVWKKGYELGVRAVRQVVDAGVPCTYTLIGDGPEMGAVAYARHRLGLESEVRLKGALPHARIAEELRSADVFLHPAVSEGFCNAVLEAQAMTLPVVTTDADGLAENVADGETGLVVPRRSPRALAEALLRLARDPAAARAMGEAGRRRVQALFRPEQELDAFEALYARALEARSARR